jgi:hypothetical protein
MKASPIAPAANALICSRLIPVDLRVVSRSANSKAPDLEFGKQNGLKTRLLGPAR